MSYVYLLFEIIYDDINKKLGYAILKNENDYLNNIENLENFDLINVLNLLLKNEKINYKQIKIIQYLKNEINDIYYSHFTIIINQKNNLLSNIEEKNQNYSIYSNDYDYDNDEYEYIYDSNILQNFGETMINYDYLEDIENLLLENKYNITICVNILEDLLEQYYLDYWSDKENIMNNENLSENEYKNEFEKIIIKNNFINLKLKQIENFKEHFNENFLKLKLVESKNKIKHYFDSYSYNFNDNTKLKLANQICRKFKYENLKEIKFNFTVSSFNEENTEEYNIQQKIVLSNKNNSIICTFQKDKIGDNKQGYTTTSYIKINDYDNLDDIIDEEILSDLFRELEKNLF